MRVLQLAVLLGSTTVISATTIGFSPPSEIIYVGDGTGDGSVSVDLSNVSDLQQFQFDIRYDPSFLSVRVSASFGAPNFSFNPGTVDNAGGVVSSISGRWDSPVSFDGRSSLAMINLHPLRFGSTTVSLGNVALLDGNMVDIAATLTQAADVTIRATPEPSSTLPLCGFMAVLVMYGHLKPRKGQT